MNEIHSREVLFPVLRNAAITRFLSVLCVFALLSVAAFGVTGAYLCRCGGQEKLIQIDHCHGPHSEGCHDSQDQSPAPTHLHDDEASSDRENHQPLRKDVELIYSAGSVAPELVPALIAVLPWFPSLRFRTEDTQLAISRRHVGFAPPTSVVVGRTVVLLM